MADEPDQLLALECLKRGSSWKSANLRRGQAFMVHSACAINIPMAFYKPSARNFADYRRDDENAKRFFDALMFFLHLIESAVNQVTTRTTAADHKRMLAVAAAACSADEAQAPQVLERYMNRNAGEFFNAGASPMMVQQDKPFIGDSQTDRDLDELLRECTGDVTSDGDESNGETSGRVASPIRTRGAFVYRPPAPQDEHRQTDVPQVVSTTTLAPSIYVLLEQVPREGRRVPGEGKFHELLDMLQVQSPLFYTLHVLSCGVDMAGLMAHTLAINTLRMRDLPVYTTPYSESQRANMFARMIMDSSGGTVVGGAQRGAARGRTRGRGRGRGGGRAGSRGGRQRVDNMDEVDGDRDDDEHRDTTNASGSVGSQLLMSMEDVQKRKAPLRSSSGQYMIRRTEPWEQYQAVTFDTIGNVYAAIFGGSQKANAFQAANPSRALQLDTDNPCHPSNMFGIAAVLLSRGNRVSYVQGFAFYMRHHEQRRLLHEHERRLQSGGGTVRQRLEALPQRDALDLSPRSPYVPEYPEHRGSDADPSIYVWSPPPGAESRFLALNITEATGAAFCNKALPHRQRSSDSVLEEVWPGLFGKRARRMKNRLGASNDDRIAQALHPAITVSHNKTIERNLQEFDLDDQERDSDAMYRILPSSLRQTIDHGGDEDQLAAFGPQVQCPVVSGQAMSIKRVVHLLNLLQQCGGTITAVRHKVKDLEKKIESVHKQLRQVANSRRVQQERQYECDGAVSESSARTQLVAFPVHLDAQDEHDALLDSGLQSSGFSFAQSNFGRFLRAPTTREHVNDSEDEFSEDDYGQSSTRIALEPSDRTMTFADGAMLQEQMRCDEQSQRQQQPTQRALLSRSACALSLARVRQSMSDGSGDESDEPRDGRYVEHASQSMPSFHSPRMYDYSMLSVDPQRLARAALVKSTGGAAPSEATIRAQQLKRLRVNHSDAHIVRVNSDALRKQLEQLKLEHADMLLLCNDRVRSDLLHARRLYEHQVKSQSQWINSVRLLLEARGGKHSALPVGDPLASAAATAASGPARALQAAQHEQGANDLEHAMALAPTPTPVNDAVMLLRGYYAHQSTERTGQLLVDINEYQSALWAQLNDRLVENSTNIAERDARAWTMIYERAALRDFEKRANDPRANIPTAMSVILECAERKSLHTYNGRMMHRRMDASMGAMENHMAWLLETYNAIFCIAKCQLTLMGWISSQCATHHANELHPNLLVMGDAAASKTYPLALMHSLRCNLGSRNVRKCTIESTRETENSTSHDGRHMMDYAVVISNEMLKSVLVGDPLEGSTGSAAFKQLMDHCQSFVHTLERNPTTGVYEYHERFASYIGVRIMCANWPMAELPLPILTRVILVPCMPSRGARNNIAQAMARRQEQRLADEKKIEQIEVYHNFLHYVQAVGDAMVLCGAMKDVNLWLLSFVMTYVNQELKRRSMVTIQPRFLQHISSWVRAIVKQSVYAREFSYVGGIFQTSDVTPERIQLLQPYLYADMRTIVFVLGMLTRYSSIEGEDDVRKAVRTIIERQREHFRTGLDSTRTVDDMFRIKGYARMPASSSSQSSASAPPANNGSRNIHGLSSFVSNIPVDHLVDNDFTALNADDSRSNLPPIYDSQQQEQQQQQQHDLFQTNFPGLREQMVMQQPPSGTRGVLNRDDNIRGDRAQRPFEYQSGAKDRPPNPFSNVTVKTRDYRYITLRFGDGKSGMPSRMDPRQWACSQGAQRLMPMLNECGSTLTRDMVCALLMLLSEQYIKSPHYQLDKDGVPQVHAGARPENIRVVEFDAGFIHISYCWLMILDVSTTQVMREVLVKLNSYRHQPRQRCLWQHNEMFPNTFETLDLGNEDCDSERHEVLELENPSYYSPEELRVLYTEREMEHHQSKQVMFVRVNCSLDHMAALKREAELRWYNGSVTERDLARVFYSAERAFGADPHSRYHNVSFENGDMDHLEDTMCLFMPDRYYQVPNDAWTDNSPKSVPRTVAHWDVLFAHEKDVEERRRAYCNLTYFTSSAVIDDRMRRWEQFDGHQYIKYPQDLHQRFMPRATECAVSEEERQSIRNLLEEEMSSRKSAPMSSTERRYANRCRAIAQESLDNLRRSKSSMSNVNMSV